MSNIRIRLGALSVVFWIDWALGPTGSNWDA